MARIKEISIKSPYYCFDDMVSIENFRSNLSKIDMKLQRDIDIYYVGYITIKSLVNMKILAT